MAIALKAARETRSWLRLVQESRLMAIDVSAYRDQVDELMRILTSIVKTTAECHYSEAQRIPQHSARIPPGGKACCG